MYLYLYPYLQVPPVDNKLLMHLLGRRHCTAVLGSKSSCNIGEWRAAITKDLQQLPLLLLLLLLLLLQQWPVATMKLSRSTAAAAWIIFIQGKRLSPMSRSRPRGFSTRHGNNNTISQQLGAWSGAEAMVATS